MFIEDSERKGILERFTAHGCSKETSVECSKMEAQCQNMAAFLLNHMPDCRELRMALTRLEEVQYWSVCGMVRTDMAKAGPRRVTESELPKPEGLDEAKNN